MHKGSGSMFWNIFIDLCEKKNIKPNPLAEIIGVSSGVVTKWKKGAMPNLEALIKIADYFDVSVDYLLERTEYTSKNITNNGTNNGTQANMIQNINDISAPIEDNEVWDTYSKLSTKDKLEIKLDILNRGSK